jgi:antitoxin CptB
LALPDQELFGWLSGEAEAPADVDTRLFRQIKRFHTHDAPIHL